MFAQFIYLIFNDEIFLEWRKGNSTGEFVRRAMRVCGKKVCAALI